MAKDILDITGKVAFITGASSRGIGSGSAKVLAEHGAKVFLTARREEQLQEQVAAIREAGGEAAHRAAAKAGERDPVQKSPLHFHL